MNTLLLGLALCSPTIDKDALKAAQQRGVPWVAILNGADLNQFGDHPVEKPAVKHPPLSPAAESRTEKARAASQARRARISARARQRAAYRAWYQRQAAARQRAYLQRIGRMQGWYR